MYIVAIRHEWTIEPQLENRSDNPESARFYFYLHHAHLLHTIIITHTAMAQQRSAITHAQKSALRAQRRAHPNAPLKDLQQWFQSRYHQPIAASSVSVICSSKAAHLDAQTQAGNGAYANSKRRRQEKWPELERALCGWLQTQTQIATEGGRGGGGAGRVRAGF